MSTWKQYGGTKNVETNKQITTNTIIADEIILKKSYIGGFSINGVLDVTGKAIIQGNLEINGTFTVGELTIKSLTSNIGTFNSIETNSINCLNNVIIGNSIISKNFKTDSITLGNIIYLNGNSFICSNVNGIGVNTLNPTSSFDICCNRIEGLNIHSDLSKNINILTSNNENKGLMLTTSDIDDNSGGTNIHLDFFVNSDLSMNTKGDGYLKYKNSGIFEISAKEKFVSLSNFCVSNRPDEVNDTIFNESITVYDNSNGIYNYDIYKKNSIITGDAITIVTNDNSSNSFFRIVTPDKSGLGIIGGAYANDTSRSMGVIGLTDSSGIFIPNQTIVSGSNNIKYKTTTGINTYKPRTENYVVDINGPIHIDNGDINITSIIDFEIKAMDSYNNLIIAAGSSIDISSSSYTNLILISNDYGSTWTVKDLSGITVSTETGTTLNEIEFNNINYTINDTFIFDSSYSFIVGNNNLILVTKNSGNNWTYLNFLAELPNTYNFKEIFVQSNTNFANFEGYISGKDPSNNSVLFKFIINKTIINKTIEISSIKDLSNININSFDIYNDLSGNKISYFATDTGIWYLDVSSQNISTNIIRQLNNTSTNRYNTIQVYGSKIIAIGNKICSILENSLLNSYSNPYSLSKLYIYNSLQFLSISGEKHIVFTKDGGQQWNTIPENFLTPSGKEQLIYDISNISSIRMSDKNTILISDVKQTYSQYNRKGESNILNCFVPKLFNSLNNNVLDVCGNMMITGDIYINDGSLKSKNNTFYILPEDVSNIIIGNSSSGTTNIVTSLSVSKNSTFVGNVLVQGIQTISNTTESGNVFTGAIIVSGGLGISGNTNIGGNLRIGRNSTLVGNVLVQGIQTVENTTESGNVLTGAFIVSGGVGISGNTNIGGNLKVGKNSTLVGNVLVQGIQTVENISESGNVSTGALVIKGGIGISGNTNIGGNLRIERNSTFVGNVFINDTIFTNNINYGQQLKLYSTQDNNSLIIGPNSQIINIGESSSSINIGLNDNNIGTINIGTGITAGGLAPGVQNISIGGKDTQTTLYGNVNFSNQQNNISEVVQFSKNFIFNASGGDNAVIANLYNSGSVFGGGIFFQGWPETSNLGQFTISLDGKAFIFKPPTYVSSAAYNVEYPTLTSQNILRLDVNTLKTTANNGLVILKPSINDDDKSKFTITSTNFDISNIFIKDTDTIGSTQSISTDVNFKSNLYFNNIITNKTTNIPNTSMDINGNVIISRLGIGTSSVHSDPNSLEIQGNIYQNDGYIIQF